MKNPVVNKFAMSALLVAAFCAVGCLGKNSNSSGDSELPAPVPAPAPQASVLALSGPSTFAAGACADFTVNSVDASNNSAAVAQDTTVSLSGAGQGAFYSDASCATAATTLILNKGQSGATVYLMDMHVESLSLSASTTGMTAGAAAAEVTSGPLSQMTFTHQPPGSATAGVAMGDVSLSMSDAFGNPVDSASVLLSAFTDNACTTPGSGTLAAGGNPGASSGGAIAFTGVSYTKAQTVYLGASLAGVTACSNAITVAPNVPAQISLNVANMYGPSIGTAYLPMSSFQVMDLYGNITLSNDIFAVGIYGDSACSAGMSVETGGNTTGSATAGFGVIDEAAGNLTPVYYFSQFTTFYVGLTDTSRSGVTPGCSDAISVNPTIAGGSTGATQCAISSSGSVYCFGEDTYGQCGDGQHAGFPPYFLNEETPVQVSGGSQGGASLAGAVSISDSDGTTCAATATGSVYCWGEGNNGPLGDGAWGMSTTPVQVLGVAGVGTLSNIVGVSVGYEFACAVSSLASGGGVYCWGLNGNGQLGNGTTTGTNTPVQVAGLTNMLAVSAGESHVCALSKTGNVFCWGDNAMGDLGNNSTTQSATPVQVLGLNGTGVLSKIAGISAGLAHNCALSGTGTVYCWGYNGMGQLGNNSFTDSHVPVQVKAAGGTNFYPAIALSVGATHSCAIQISFVYCWGDNEYGQLGNGNAPNDSAIPVHVSQLGGGSGGLGHIMSIGSSEASTCALTDSKGVVCWGSNSSGQLGNNSLSQSNFPVQVLGVSGAGNLGL